VVHPIFIVAIHFPLAETDFRRPHTALSLRAIRKLVAVMKMIGAAFPPQ